MKIKNEILKEFIKETSLNGDYLVTESVLNFEDDGLSIKALSQDNAVIIIGKLKKESFEVYETIGKIPILNYSDLLKILSALKQDVTITKEEHVLVFKGGRKVEVPIAEESLIKSLEKVPNINYETKSLNINSSVFLELENNNVFANNKGDAVSIKFLSEGNNQLKILYGNKYKFTDIVSVDSTDNFEVNYGLALINSLHNLTGDLSVNMATDYPATIIKETNGYNIKIIVAPRIINN